MKSIMQLDRVSLDTALHVALVVAGVAALGVVCMAGDVLTVIL